MLKKSKLTIKLFSALGLAPFANMAVLDVAVAQSISEVVSIEEFAGYNRSGPSPYIGGIMAVGDVNGDQFDDILVGFQSPQVNYPVSVYDTKPILMVYDPAARRYTPSSEFQAVVGTQIWPRRAAIIDFEGDGFGDIFVAGHGTDGMNIMHCGDQNLLIKSSAAGFENRTGDLPQVSDYSHGLTVGRFDGDSVDDLFILNSPFIEKKCPKGKKYSNTSYALSGARIFSGKKVKVSGVSSAINVSGGDEFAHHGSTGDVNRDGIDDLIVGGDFEVTVFESKGPGNYRKAGSFPPPGEYFELFDTSKCLSDRGRCFTPYSAFAVIDIDGNGSSEIVASLLNQRADGGWQGQYLQVLKKVDDAWIDATSEFLAPQRQSQTSEARWCNELHVLDANGDGRQDLLCSAIDQNARSFWMNEGGRLSQSSRTSGAAFLTPVRLGSSVRIVGLQTVNSGSFENFRVKMAN